METTSVYGDDVTRCLTTIKDWYETCHGYVEGRGVARGTIAAALVVLDNLAERYDLNITAHVTDGQGQLRGLGGSRLAEVLVREVDEHRTFLREGGRTNRGAMGEIGRLLSCLKPLYLDALTQEGRSECLRSMMNWLAKRAVETLNRKGLQFQYDAGQTTHALIAQLLATAHQQRIDGPVAEYLVGAKLALRFFGLAEIRNTSYSTSDVQHGEHGDFQIAKTVFHVTVSPTEVLVAKCRENGDSGLGAYVLVPDEALVSTRMMFKYNHVEAAVESIESFVSQNIDELSLFSETTRRAKLAEIFRVYNARVAAVETDPGLSIRLPTTIDDSEGV